MTPVQDATLRALWPSEPEAGWQSRSPLNRAGLGVRETATRLRGAAELLHTLAFMRGLGRGQGGDGCGFLAASLTDLAAVLDTAYAVMGEAGDDQGRAPGAKAAKPKPSGKPRV